MQYKEISSPENPIYKFIKSLHKKKAREESGLFLIEGLRLVEEAIRNKIQIKYLILNEKIEDLPCMIPSCEILRFKNSLFKEIADTVTPQGIIGVAEKFDQKLLDFSLENKNNPLLVVLNALQDPGNIGTIIRTCAAAGVNAVLLTKGTGEIYNPKVIRSTMGALFQIPIINNLEDNFLINWLQNNNISSLIADVSGEDYYYNVDLKTPLAIVIGNENVGPSILWKQNANHTIKIPMLRDTESLNASIAAGIIIYDAIRQRS